jgi:glycosyltransferase involved in cell wall biosynthesis
LGGAEQVVIRLAAALDRARFEPMICCLNDPGRFASQALAAGIEVLAFNKRGAIDPGFLLRLTQTFKRRRVGVVHTHLWGANVWGRLAASFAGVPRVIATEHSVDNWKRPHHLMIDRALARRTPALVAVSEQVRTFYESKGVGRGRWHVIHNGIQVSGALERRRGAPYQDLGIANDEPVVGYVGRFAPEKAPELFIEAFARAAARIPRLRALMVGDGPLRAATEEHARTLGVASRVVFTGVRQDVPELLAGMDALMISSYREGLSIAILEAMAAGVPVVATDVGGNSELVESGVTGYLVPSGDVAALARDLSRVVEEPEHATRMRDSARRKVQAAFSMRSMVAAHEALYTGGPSP